MPTPRAAKTAETESDSVHRPTYFELITEIEPEDLPEPIRVPASGGAKSFVITVPDGNGMFAMRGASNMNDYDRGLLGDAYPAAVAMYGKQPRQVWLKFISQVENHFYGTGASSVAAPGKSRA